MTNLFNMKPVVPKFLPKLLHLTLLLDVNPDRFKLVMKGIEQFLHIQSRQIAEGVAGTGNLPKSPTFR